MKKLLVTCFTVFTVLAFAGAAFATPGLIDIRTTVPNIAKSLCDQAGSQSLAIPDQTSMQVGDVIQFTLDTGVTICKTLDFYIPIANALAFTPPSLATDAVQVSNTAVGANVINTIAATNTPVYGGVDDIGFHVRGNDGSQIYTLQLVKRTVATGALDATGTWAFTFNVAIAPLGDPANDNLTVKLFDEKTIALGAPVSLTIYDDNPPSTTGVYTHTILTSDNVLCIDTLTGDFQGNQVQSFPDSLPVTSATKLTFTGVYTIANILPANIFTISNPCKDPCPQIEIEATFDQFDNPTSGITEFDPGNYAPGVCTGSRMSSQNTCDPTEGMLLRIKKNSAFTVGVKLYLSLTLQINGASAVGTIGWADNTIEPPVVFLSTGASDVCNCTGTSLTPVGGLNWTRSGTNTVLTQSLMTPIIANGTATTLEIDLSNVNITDLEDLDDGDQITVLASLYKGNCGELFNGELCIANVLDLCTTLTPAGACYSFTLPYSVGTDDPDFWGGLAVSNQTMTNGEWDLTMYDVDGNMATLNDQALDALNMDVFLLSDIPSRTGYNAGAIDPAVQMWLRFMTDFYGDAAIFVGDTGLNILQGYKSTVMTTVCP
jgi:hypothetical protein